MGKFWEFLYPMIRTEDWFFGGDIRAERIPGYVFLSTHVNLYFLGGDMRAKRIPGFMYSFHACQFIFWIGGGGGGG